MVRAGSLCLLLAVCAAAIPGVGGCQRQRADDGASTLIPRPAQGVTYAQIRDAVNARAARLERLWARATVRVVRPDGEGGQARDQGDGFLQIVGARRLSLSIGKSIDRMYFFLGSDEERYWWVDVLDRDRRVAMVGTHERATPARAEEFGVPVHPLDLIELLGIRAIPEDGPEPIWNGEIGGWVVRAPLAGGASWGERRIVVDPVELLPIAVAIVDGEFSLSAGSRLESYARLDEWEGEGVAPEIPRRVTIELPRIETMVTLDLSAGKGIARLPTDAAFDLDRLLSRERVDDVRDLDGEAGPGEG